MNKLHHWDAVRTLANAKGANIETNVNVRLLPVVKHRLERLLRGGRPCSQTRQGKLGFAFGVCSDVLHLPMTTLDINWHYDHNQRTYSPEGTLRVVRYGDCAVDGVDLARLKQNIEESMGMAYMLDFKVNEGGYPDMSGQMWTVYTLQSPKGWTMKELRAVVRKLGRKVFDGVFAVDFELPSVIRFSADVQCYDYAPRSRHEFDIARRENYWRVPAGL